MIRADATPSRPVPFTEDRAITEAIRSRRHLDSAVRSLELAVEIFARLNGQAQAPVRAMEEVLGRLEEAEAALSVALSRSAD